MKQELIEKSTPPVQKLASQVLLEANPDMQVKNCISQEMTDGKYKYCAMGILAKVTGNLNRFEKIEMSTNEMLAGGYNMTGLDKHHKCPECEKRAGTPYLIMHLNDDHDYTYKEVGMFLQGMGY